MAERVFAVVPIKPFESAKTRLGTALDDAQRAALAEVSAGRVLTALSRCTAIDRRIAVVEDEATAAFARRHYFEPLLRPDVWGQSAAVDAGFEVARSRGADTVLTLSADVPLAGPDDVEQLLRDAGPLVVLAPDRRRDGTNALRLSPALPFRLHFGRGSLAQHEREAAAMGLPVRIVRNPRLELDLDDPDDVSALERSGPEGRQVLIDAGRVRLEALKLREAPEPA